jgi:hypothetical protein
MEQACSALIDSMTSNRAVAVELEHECEQNRNQLGYENASALERALIDAVVLAWLRYADLERRYSNVMKGSISLQQADFWERRLGATQRRYLRAIETLARVRRLAIPAMQVNIGAQQVNAVIPGRDK